MRTNIFVLFYVLLLLPNILNKTFAADQHSSFIAEVMQRLPPRMTQELSKIQLTINFDLPPNLAGSPFVYGKLVHAKNSPGAVISLSEHFLQEILLGEELASPHPGNHKNWYRKAQATVIHELTHLYLLLLDRHNGEVSVAMEQRHKQEQHIIYQIQHLLNWEKKRLMGYSQHNTNLGASPDSYEYEKIDESLPVNMEYFLLDPDFKCRRPAVAKMLRKLMDEYDPYPLVQCPEMTLVGIVNERNFVKIIPTENDLAELNPQNVYQIHYLIAGGGEAMESRWGHAMIRIVLCAPGRERGPQCLDDVAHHLVFDYTAEVHGIDGVDGIFSGEMPAKGKIRRFSEVVDRYTLGGNGRELISLPLQITDDEKETIIYKILQDLSEYEGRYRVLSENCATLASNLLKASFSLPTNGLVHACTITPSGLSQNLCNTGYCTTGSRFAPLIEEINNHPELLPSTAATASAYLQLTATERRQNFIEKIDRLSHIKGKHRSEILRAINIFVDWENKIEGKIIEDRNRQIKEGLLADNQLKNYLISLDHLNEHFLNASPAAAVYGIPTKAERDAYGKFLIENQFSKLLSLPEFQTATENIASFITQKMKEFQVELNNTNENSMYLFSLLPSGQKQ
ncbi:MAG: DUF4105 domain-containing protein [Oligoflexia bacterium]|nr:DUF4105 domain-containing protein [Oligoflexia bacterium]